MTERRRTGMTSPDDGPQAETNIEVIRDRAAAYEEKQGWRKHIQIVKGRMQQWQKHVDRLGDKASQSDKDEAELWRTIYHDTIARRLLLVVSEVTEAYEHLRDGREPNEVFFKIISDPAQAKDDVVKPDGFPIEIADAIIRLLNLSEETEADVARDIADKMDFNDTREFRHGRVT